ncbi:hypothetical protein [Alkalicoccus halolimnae]|uniref:Uncharacterized protein n=1 Tax=Alkalicoccus halolimnae TaxID=1667239 RepID=A0A5C7FHY9_9BACI|nr:hypothetical protein [Alkalicoccus halolimnae]TXF83605.1 hypothetical protein FTX54_12315 [Alkalicoccus halolimnae]
MKKGIAAVFILLAACGQGEEGSITNPDDDNNTEDTSETIVVHVPAENQDDLIETLRSWSETELDNSDGGLFIATDNTDGPAEEGEIVQQIAAEDLSETAESLEAYGEAIDAEETFPVHLNSVSYTREELLGTLEQFPEEDGSWYEEGAFLGGSVFIQSNTVEIRVTSKEDVNESAMEKDLGSLDFISWEESSSSVRGPDGLPEEEPDHTGTVTNINEEGRPLIDNDLYITIIDADVFKEDEQIAPDEIEEGEDVQVWTAGSYLDSDPQQGEALVVNILTEETEEADTREQLFTAPVEKEIKVSDHAEEVAAQDSAVLLEDPDEIEQLAYALQIKDRLDSEAGPYLAASGGESGTCPVEPEKMQIYSDGTLELHPDPIDGQNCNSDYNPYTLIIPVELSFMEEVEMIDPTPVSDRMQLPLE